jgi:hypothetical protein
MVVMIGREVRPVVRRSLADVRFPPERGRIADIGGCLRRAITGREQMRQIEPLFDHLVGAGENRRTGDGGQSAAPRERFAPHLNKRNGGLPRHP